MRLTLSAPPLATAPLFCALAIGVLGGCTSSTTSNGPNDSGTSPLHDGGFGALPEGGAGDDAGVPVGETCASDSDCVGGARCTATLSGNPLYPSSICIAECTSGSGTQIESCGTDTLPGAGLCEPGAQAGLGVCLPLCYVTPAGISTGCLANDVCQLLGTIPDPNDATQIDGAGWCQPGCTASSQCPSGTECDPLGAACVKQIVPTTLPIGATCNPTSATSQCNCVAPANSTTGYCTAVCVTGVSTCPSPPDDGGAPDDGGSSVPWVCSAQLNLEVDAGITFTKQPSGLYGFCAPPCNTNADCASIGGTCSTGDPAAPSGFTGTCGVGP